MMCGVCVCVLLLCVFFMCVVWCVHCVGCVLCSGHGRGLRTLQALPERRCRIKGGAFTHKSSQKHFNFKIHVNVCVCVC